MPDPRLREGWGADGFWHDNGPEADPLPREDTEPAEPPTRWENYHENAAW